MGLRQSKPDMYVLMIEGDAEVCALGIFSNMEKAIAYSHEIGENTRRMWIEKFRLDEPSHYEDENEYITWKSK